MSNNSGKKQRFIFLGLAIIFAISAAAVFFHRTDSQIYNLSLSSPNSFPQKYVSFLKDNERWKSIISFAELYNYETEQYTDELSEELRTALIDITNSATEAQEQRKTFSYWKKEGLKAVMLKKGEEAPQEALSKVTSTLVDMYAGDYITLIDAGQKYIGNEKEEIDKFNTALSAVGASLGIASLFTGGTAAPLTTPNHYLIYVLKMSVQKMKEKLRNDFFVQLTNIIKDPSLLIRYKSLANIAFYSPDIAIWLLSIPNDLEQGERLWNLLSNCYSKKEMKNVIKHATLMLSFYNKQNNEESNRDNLGKEKEIEILPTNKINNNSSDDIKTGHNANDLSEDKGFINKTIDYIGKKKEELLNKENKISTSKPKMFEERELIMALEEIISALEIMDQQNRMSSKELFFALCYGQNGLDALKQNKLKELMEYRDCISSNSFEFKVKKLVIEYKNPIVMIFSIVSLFFLAVFIFCYYISNGKSNATKEKKA